MALQHNLVRHNPGFLILELSAGGNFIALLFTVFRRFRFFTGNLDTIVYWLNLLIAMSG